MTVNELAHLLECYARDNYSGGNTIVGIEDQDGSPALVVCDESKNVVATIFVDND